MYDTIIIGTGIAGLSAALTLKALKINFIWIGGRELSQKIRKAEKISNYPGLIAVSGEQMAETFLAQAESAGIEITEGKVNGVYKTDGGFTLLCGDKSYESKTVILTTGTETHKPVSGEAEFLGRGVSYCAVCDGFLYKGKTIAVYAESEDEAAEVALLAGYAKLVYLFCSERVKVDLDNVKRVGAVIGGISGDMRVKKVKYIGGELDVDGVFMLKQSVGADVLVHGLKGEDGFVSVDRKCRTNIDGVFAAGDITGRPFQYAKAAGEGNVCAYSVFEYLKK